MAKADIKHLGLSTKSRSPNLKKIATEYYKRFNTSEKPTNLFETFNGKSK